MLPYIGANRGKAAVNIFIGVTKNRNPQLSQFKVSLLISLTVFCQSVLSAINFNHNTVTVDIEIHNVVADILLAVDSNGKFFQKIVPQMLLFSGHIFAKLLG